MEHARQIETEKSSDPTAGPTTIVSKIPNILLATPLAGNDNDAVEIVLGEGGENAELACFDVG